MVFSIVGTPYYAIGFMFKKGGSPTIKVAVGAVLPTMVKAVYSND